MYKSIQCLRALAALLVVLFHLSIALASAKYFGVAPLEGLFQFGDSGVAFFFVLSGFIIAHVHAGDLGRPERLASYLRKRAVRIYPTYFILFGVAYASLLLLPETRATAPHDPILLLKSLALIPQDKAVVGGTGAPVLIVAWSLQYEICFYALFALAILSRVFGLVLVPLLAANFIGCHTGVCTFSRAFLANNLFLLFGLGVLLAYCARRPLRLPQPLRVASIAAAAFVLYALLETLLGREWLPVDRHLVYGGLGGLLLYALVQAEDTGRLAVRNRWLVLLGDASYVLYLIHYPLISALCKVLRALGLHGVTGAVVAFFAILAACLLAGVGFHLWVERPLLRALSSRPSGRRAGLAPGLAGAPAVSPQSE
ncbi:MAG TPA: acyltransferase [Steroidobacteraceae bacterium]|nr:acyltransferase [Steroidobacteraceae bacterium]